MTYTNTEDFSYCLYLHKSAEDFTADLLDYRRSEVHTFLVQESSKNGEIQFTFSYKKSRKIRHTNNFKNYRYEFSKISEGFRTTAYLNVYQSKKAKKPLVELDMTLVKADKNLFPVFRLTWMQHYDNHKSSDQIGNYIISSVREKYKNDVIELGLKEFKNINMEIVLPKRLIYNDFNKQRFLSGY